MDENTVRRRSIAIPRLQPVETDADIERLAKLAHEIWFEYWPAHIGEAQTRYMVERFQTAEAIHRDMASSATRPPSGGTSRAMSAASPTLPSTRA